MYREKEKTWKDNWNDIIRYVFFQDEKMMALMCIPKDTTITEFIERYFIEDAVSSEILTNEKVRIIHYDTNGSDTGNKNVLNRYKEMDIFVKDDVLHTATRDKLQSRYDLICERIKYLLLNETYVFNMRFRFVDSYNLWTKTSGYRRYHVVFSYKTTV